jgi:tRNA(adenine34) deaminase
MMAPGGHEFWMQQALAHAHHAGSCQEVPVGCVIVHDGHLLAQAGNATINACDPTAHAEIQALRMAAKRLGNHRLLGAVLYVTLEPCLMCWHAAVHARIKMIVYGAHDLRKGVFSQGLVQQLAKSVNHHCQVVGGVLAEQAAHQLHTFFLARRQ